MSEESNPENSNAKNQINEKMQFTIAVIVVAPFIMFVGLFHLFGMTQESKDILTMLGALVGTIIGFYFGQRPIQSLTKQVAEAKSESQLTKNNLVETYHVTEIDSSLIDNLNEQIRVRDEIIANLKRKADVE